MNLKELLNGVKFELLQGDIEVDINKFEYDSRKLNEHDLFICMRGIVSDGHLYIKEAVLKNIAALLVEDDITLPFDITIVKTSDNRKAAAIIAKNYYRRVDEQFKLIGVTGTNGKTTITHLIHRLLQYFKENSGLIGTNGTEFDGIFFENERTTPEARDLFKIFHDMHLKQVDYAVMEVSSHSLDLHRVLGLQFFLGIFTNLTQDHLDFHQTMDQYKKAKQKLFQQCDLALINADDPQAKYFTNSCNQTYTYSIDQISDYQALNISIHQNGVRFDLCHKKKLFPIEFSTPGRFSVYNALAATAALHLLGFSLEKIANAFRQLASVKGRFEKVELANGALAIVDYSHTPDSLKNALETVKEFATAKVFCVFGCGGDRDKAKRPMMGQIASQLADYVIITSDNPRSEKTMDIMMEIEKGLQPSCAYEMMEDRKAAIQKAVELSQANDIILIAGKGHETYQIIGNEVKPFDDIEVVRQAGACHGFKNQ